MRFTAPANYSVECFAHWLSLMIGRTSAANCAACVGVGAACALAGAFAKAGAQASSDPAMRGIAGFVLFDDSKTRRAWDQCHPQTVKENLSAYFGVFGIFEGTLSHR